MATQETYLTAFVDSIQTTAERFIQISQFDKTIKATITEKSSDGRTYYVTSNGGARFSVPILENDNDIYSIGDQVYINLPNGDYNSANKYIVGKIKNISPQIAIFQKEDHLIEDYNSQNTDHSNKRCNQTMIIEFDAYIKTKNSEARSIKEKLVELDIYGRTREDQEKWAHRKTFWSTKNLYGNIFDDFIINKQRIIVENLETLFTFGVDWNGNDAVTSISIPVDLLDLKGDIIQEPNGQISTLEINNITYYIGYAPEKIQQNQIQNTSILLTDLGYKLFHYKDGEWSIVTFDELEELESEYDWEIFWYTWNPLQEEYISLNNPVPPFWDLLSSAPSVYKDKLILLQCSKGDNKIGQKTAYSILR